jgi:hypothetical protein
MARRRHGSGGWRWGCRGDDVPRSLRLMAEYGCSSPLWLDGGYVDPKELPLPAELGSALEAWAASFNATLDHAYPPDSRLPTEAEKISWLVEGRRLGRELQTQLGPTYEVVYFHDRNA